MTPARFLMALGLVALVVIFGVIGFATAAAVSVLEAGR